MNLKCRTDVEESAAEQPRYSSEIDDHNNGLVLCRSLLRFFDTQSHQSRKFFRKFSENATVKELLEQAHACTSSHYDRANFSREKFDRWNQLKERAFAKKTSREILPLLGVVKLGNYFGLSYAK